MRESGVNWPAAVVPAATDRTGGSRMLLDELFAERERVETPPTPAPVLSVDPVVVPQAVDTSRRAVKQRLADLESAARRNYMSAEEARRVLADEHHRLEQELSARTHAQHEAAALRRELERLTTEETRRSAQERTRAEREARAAVAEEIERFGAEHERLVQELASVRNSISDHDGLLQEYAAQLREEQGARAAMRAEVDRAEAARSLAERSLQRATENARQSAEDEMIRLATADQKLADAVSDRDRLATQLAELTAGDGAISRLNTQLEERDAEIARLGVCLADLEATVAEQLESDDLRAREIDKTLGKLRREARDASNARRTAEEELATAESERDELRARVAELEAESVRARAEGDRLRVQAATLGDERAAARQTVAELQAAASAPSTESHPARAATEVPSEAAAEFAVAVASQTEVEPHTPLPSRIAGSRTPAPPLERRRPRRDPSLPTPTCEPEVVHAVARMEIPPEVVPESKPRPDAEPAAAPGDESHRRTALAEFTALATSGDDGGSRRR